jgi:hypothetical protein
MTWIYWLLAVPQIVLYSVVGVLKIAKTPEHLIRDHGFEWVRSMPESAVKAIGVAEASAALALAIPPIIGFGLPLTFAAAAGLSLLQIGALIVNVRTAERRRLLLNVASLAVAIATAMIARGA